VVAVAEVMEVPVEMLVVLCEVVLTLVVVALVVDIVVVY
jgi:hypothetical protein